MEIRITLLKKKRILFEKIIFFLKRLKNEKIKEKKIFFIK
jgi:hypothetical protein